MSAEPLGNRVAPFDLESPGRLARRRGSMSIHIGARTSLNQSRHAPPQFLARGRLPGPLTASIHPDGRGGIPQGYSTCLAGAERGRWLANRLRFEYCYFGSSPISLPGVTMSLRRFASVLTLMLALFFVFSPHADSATPRRPAGSYYFGPSVVYTNGSAADFWNPVSDGMPSRTLMAGRVTMEVSEAANAGNIKMRPALQWSADGVNWDTAVAINTSYVTGNGAQATTGFTDFSGLGAPKPFVRFGVLTYTVNGSAYELARATLVIEPKAATQ